jgi:hypothetical protein
MNPLSARTQYLINVYVTLNSAGRKDQFQRGRYSDPRQGSFQSDWNEHGPLLGQVPSEAELAALEDAGFIKRSKNGAITATDLARNLRTGSLGCIAP